MPYSFSIPHPSLPLHDDNSCLSNIFYSLLWITAFFRLYIQLQCSQITKSIFRDTENNYCTEANLLHVLISISVSCTISNTLLSSYCAYTQMRFITDFSCTESSIRALQDSSVYSTHLFLKTNQNPNQATSLKTSKT